jgi:hypothetical protein
MEDTKRFLRYVLPGLASFLQFLAYVLFYNKQLLDKYLVTNNQLITIASAFIVAGLIGFIFSNIYYFFFWKLYFKKGSILDYRLVIKNNLPLFKKGFKIKDVEVLRQRECWALMNVYWKMTYNKNDKKEKMVYNSKFKALDIQIEKMNNILHSIGSTFVIIIIGWILFAIFVEFCSWYTVVNLAVIFFLGANYRIVAHLLQSMLVRAHENLRIKQNIKRHPLVVE